MPTALSLRNNSKGYAVRSSQDAYGIVPPKQLRGLRGTVIILRDRADAVTAGVLTKELFLIMPTVLSLRKSSEGYAVRSSSYVNVLMLLLLVCLPKRLFFFCSHQY